MGIPVGTYGSERVNLLPKPKHLERFRILWESRWGEVRKFLPFWASALQQAKGTDGEWERFFLPPMIAFHDWNAAVNLPTDYSKLKYEIWTKNLTWFSK